MSDFVQMMKDWGKMCNSNYECQKCRLSHNPVCGALSHATDEDISKAEADIMAWAAEHPEPVYPTWFDWLKSEDILIVDIVPCQSNPTSTSTQQLYVALLRGTAKMFKPIPAEIAEKLEIEPKEETYDKN